MDLESAQQTFLAESRELLREMEDALLRLERGGGDAGAVNEVFRAAHTIKGSAGAFGYDDIVEFTHVVESVLVEMRAGAVRADPELFGLLLACGDHIGGLLAAVSSASPVEGALRDRGVALVSALRRVVPDEAAPPAAAAAPAPGARRWRVAARFAQDVMRYGLDPVALLRHLATVAAVERVRSSFDDMPEAEAMDPEACYLAIDVELACDEARTIEDAFEFALGHCELRIEALDDAAASAPGEASAAPGPGGTRADPFVRVRADKLDELITLVGELVIAGAGTRMLAQREKSAEMAESAATLERLAQEVRDGALKLRMIPIAETFGRFKRVARDLGHELGKEIQLVLSGTDTEVDKSMAERIVDPLTHLVRNALDHGIEDAATRARLGKPAVGTLHLNAYHDSGSIVIEVGDDGAGLDREKIRERAVERGLIAADAPLGDEEVTRLVMEPGFSTASLVTSVSGRGIGMDVVRRNVEALRGSVSISSIQGEGTVVSIRLPLTLAIIDGFVVGVGRAAYVVPLDAVVECIELPAAQRAGLRGRGFIDLRDEALPVVRLRDAFGVGGDAGRRENVVVVQCAGRRAGFVVDALLGEFQTVIKPLGKLFERLSGISGSTILGNGEVGLILDVQALVQRAEASEAAHTRIATNTAAHRTPGDEA